MGRYLYIGEVGYGNLGDDACATLLQEELGDELEVIAFGHSLEGLAFEVLLIGGGTLMSLSNVPWLAQMEKLSRWAKHTVLLGTGLDPGEPWVPDAVALLRTILSRAKAEDRLLRGPLSVQTAGLIGGGDCKVGLDPLVLYQAPEGNPTSNGHIVVVPGHQARSPGGPHFQSRLIAGMKHINGAGWPVALQAVWDRDLDLALTLAHEFTEGHLASHGVDLDTVAGVFAGSHAVIANRMHAGLLALICGVPAFFVAHHIKVVDLCMALEWEWYCNAGADDLADRLLDFALQAPAVPTGRIAMFRKVMLEQVERIRRWSSE